MAPLIDCPECGRRISSQAQACPQCGKPSSASTSATVAAPLEKPSLLQAVKRGAFWLAVALSVSKIGTSELLVKMMEGNLGQADLDLILTAAKSGAPLAIALVFTLLSIIPLWALISDLRDCGFELIRFLGSLPFICSPILVTMAIAGLGLRSDLDIKSIWTATGTFVGYLSIPHTRSFIEHCGMFLYQFEAAFWGKYSLSDWLTALAFTAYLCWILLVIGYRWLVDKVEESIASQNKGNR